MNAPCAAPRPTCAKCQRPQSTCFCAWVAPVFHPRPVLILQHPLEQHHAKGSGRLLHLSLPNSRLEVGERFDEDALAGWLGPSAVLLYPGQGLPAPSPPCPAAPLVVLDATWRKSRLMLHANPLLQRLPRLSLSTPPPSRYTVRRAHRSDQRSTLEATLLALEALDGAHPSHPSVLAAFQSLQQAWLARATAGE